MERLTFTREDPDIVLHDEKTSPESHSQKDRSIKEEKDGVITTSAHLPPYTDEEQQDGDVKPLETAEDIVTTVIDLEDDPTISPWTFRMFFIGIYFLNTTRLSTRTDFCLGLGLSCFGAVLEEIFTFKPQVIFVSVMFLTVIAYVNQSPSHFL
jgi:hypothetical protein